MITIIKSGISHAWSINKQIICLHNYYILDYRFYLMDLNLVYFDKIIKNNDIHNIMTKYTWNAYEMKCSKNIGHWPRPTYIWVYEMNGRIQNIS